MELKSNPKFLQMMMPSASMLNNLGRAAPTGSASIFHTMNHPNATATGSKYHTTSSCTNNTFAPSYMSTANYNNDEEYEIPCENTTYTFFSQMATNTGMGGRGFYFGKTASTGEGGSCGAFDFGSIYDCSRQTAR